MALTLHHLVSIADARAHLVQVTTSIASEEALGTLTIFMPVWTPGSYLIREFARHVEGLTCERVPDTVTATLTVTATKVRKNAWEIACGEARAVRVRYLLYANDLSVRTNHVDETHAFLNGAATFFAVRGREDAPATVTFEIEEGWSVATALPAIGRRTFAANGLDALVDAPFEIGSHAEERFTVLGTEHRIVAWPGDAVDPRDLARFAKDAALIAEHEADLFDDEAPSFPYPAYTCILHLSQRGRGGLEHAASATLLAGAASFATREAYLDLLSLFAHELFHAWNVKRIRPAAFTPYRYEEESYTRLLWWFEGATSYYDWRVLRDAGLCTVVEYLDHLAGEIAYVEAAPGRHVQALEEASFDAWIKLYRPDENSANSSISYYRKGEVVSAMLDLEIRVRSEKGETAASLDDVLEALWSDHGKPGLPVSEDALPGVILRATGVDVGERLLGWVSGKGEIDCETSLAPFGLRIERTGRGDRVRGSLGFRLHRENGRIVVGGVVRGGAAQRGGVDVGDELIALDGRRVDGTVLDALLRGKNAGDTIDVTLAREGRILVRAVTLDPPRADKLKIMADPEATPEQRSRFAGWLGEAHPAWSAS